MNETVRIIITIALTCYTIGVWGEKIHGRLSYCHVILFFLGLIFDTWGTGIMLSASEGISMSFHGIAGLIAIILMFIHAIWAIVVLVKNKEKQIVNFHKYSLMVWLVWLIPYLSPMFIHLF